MTVEYDHVVSTVDFYGHDLWDGFRVRKDTAALTSSASVNTLDAEGAAKIAFTGNGLELRTGQNEVIVVVDLSMPAGLEMRGLRLFYFGLDEDPAVNNLEVCVKADGTWYYWDDEAVTPAWTPAVSPMWGPTESLEHINDKVWPGAEFIVHFRLTRADGEASPVLSGLWAATSIRTRNWDVYVLRQVVAALEARRFHGRAQLLGVGSNRIAVPALPSGYLSPQYEEAYGAGDSSNILTGTSNGSLVFSRNIAAGESVLVGFTFTVKVYVGESLEFIEAPDYPSLYIAEVRNNNAGIGGHKLSIPIQKTDMSQPKALTFSWPRSTQLFATLGALVDKYYDASSILGDIHDALDRAEIGLAVISLPDTAQIALLEDRGDIVDVMSQSNKLGVKAAQFPIRLGYPVPIPVVEEDMVISFTRSLIGPMGTS